MTCQDHCTLPNEITECLISQGMDYVPEMIRILINLAMQVERQAYLQAGPYERTPERKDYAKGYKPKTVNTRMGPITFQVPQVRKWDFYPSSLEKGSRSGQALKLALAEMYV